MLEKGLAFIEALKALSRDPQQEIVSLAAMTSTQIQAGVEHFRERFEEHAFRSCSGEEPEGGAIYCGPGVEAQEGEPEGGAGYYGLGVEAQEGAPHCSLSGVGEDSVPSQDGMLEALVEGLAALAMACVPPQLKQLQDEYRELYRKVFSE